MDLRYLARNAETARRMRRLWRLGIVGSHLRVWTPPEDSTVRTIYPDYARLRRELPHRTYNALRGRARHCGVAKPRPQWTADEITRLRRLYPSKSHSELLEAFPGASLERIRFKARCIGVSRSRLPFLPTGFPLIDEIRNRAFDLNLSMVELDAMAETQTYFQKAGWGARHRENTVAVIKAVRALDGDMEIEWDE